MQNSFRCILIAFSTEQVECLSFQPLNFPASFVFFCLLVCNAFEKKSSCLITGSPSSIYEPDGQNSVNSFVFQNGCSQRS